MALFKARFENMGFLFFMTIFPIRWLVFAGRVYMPTMIDDWCKVTGFLGGFSILTDLGRAIRYSRMELWINQRENF